MRVVGFVGSSGTGKSFRAMDVAKKNSITHIIDDGLLISENRIIAGVSAKREATKLASVKRALFLDDEHRAIVRSAIADEKPEGILVIGTSDKMVAMICDSLGLPALEKTIRIEDVSNEKDIARAQEIRKTEGKHVIPVPTFEIKEDFSGYWMQAIRKLKKNSASDRVMEEKSVVRPTFSYLGDYNISNRVITDIAKFETENVSCIYKVLQCQLKSEPQGIEIAIDVCVSYGGNIKKCAHEAMTRVKKAIETYTSINVISVDILVKDLKR